MFSTYKALTDASWALCGGANNRPESVEDPEERVQRERQTRELAAMSKSGQWGPTHSYESDEEVRGGTTKKGTWSGDWGWSSSGQSRAASAALTPPKAPAELKRSTGTDSTESSSSSPKAASPPPEIKKPTAPSSWGPWARCTQDTTVDSTIKSKNSNLMDYVEDVCSPCQPRNLSAAAAHLDSFPPNDDRPSLGICRLEPPGCGNTSVHSSSPRKTLVLALLRFHRNRLPIDEDNVTDEDSCNDLRVHMKILKSPPTKSFQYLPKAIWNLNHKSTATTLLTATVEIAKKHPWIRLHSISPPLWNWNVALVN